MLEHKRTLSAYLLHVAVLQPAWRVGHSRVFFWQENTCTRTKTCVLSVWFSIVLSYDLLSSLLHVTSDLFHEPWRVRPSALPVDTATVTQGCCLSLSVLEHRRSPPSRWPALWSKQNTQSPCIHTHTCVHAMPKLKHCAWHHWENRNVPYANEIKSS